jgi:hypothetical protein
VSALAEEGGPGAGGGDAERMIALNEEIVRRSVDFYGYTTPTDFRMEQRHFPELYPTNVRPETLEQERGDGSARPRPASWRRRAVSAVYVGELRRPLSEERPGSMRGGIRRKAKDGRR